MSILQALFSLKSISFIAFLATAGFLGYEVYLLWKSRRIDKTPDIPQFTDATPLDLSGLNLPLNITTVTQPKATNTYILIGVLAFMLIMFGIGSLLGPTTTAPAQKVAVVVPTAIPLPPKDVIKVYDQNWSEAINLKAGAQVFVGVQNVGGAVIDKARIRINETSWTAEHETTNFKPEQGVFYRALMIPADISNLQIEAQLHSSKDGWLGQ